MFDSLESCTDAWKRAGNHGGKQERIERNLRWMRYYAYVCEHQPHADASVDSHAANAVNTLFRQGFLTPQSAVLDIGSGTGTYALAFASRCAEVTALDMESSSLKMLGGHAAQLGLKNIICEESMWENYRPNRTFAFVFSSMCPAICDYDELLRMESLSECACGVIAVTRGSCDLHRKHLMELFHVRPTAGMTTEALWYYETLYLAGRQPNVQSWSAHYEYAAPVEEACRRNEVYFEIFGIPAEKSRPVLQEYFASQAAGGLVRDETHLNTALVSWQV
jgi:SAM-dependent methyltransferase